MPSPLYNAYYAISALSAYISRTINMTSSDVSTASSSLSSAINKLPYVSDYFDFWNSVSSLATSIKPSKPSATNPLTLANNPLILVENALILSLPPQLITAHPAAAGFPGLANTSIPTTTVTVTINGTYPGIASGFIYSGAGSDGFMPVGLYARPGDLITVNISQTTGTAFSVLISPHTDDLSELTSLRRYPIISKKVQITSNTTYIANPFGGLIFITVLKGSTLGMINVTISGGIPSPLYQHGITTLDDWNNYQRKLSAPTSVISSNKLALYVPTAWITSLTDPVSLMNFWDKVMTANEVLMGVPRTRAETIACDVQISAGYMHSGYPIMAPLEEFQVVNLTLLSGSGPWGYYHEIGHNFQWSPTVIDGTTEVTVNLFTLHAFHTVNNLTTSQARPGWNRVTDRNTYFAAWPTRPNYSTWKSSPFLALDTFVLLQEAFTWSLYKTFFVEYYQVPSSSWPSDDAGRRGELVKRLSTISGYNLYPYFDTWGVTINSTYISSVANLPVWKSDPIIYLHASPTVAATSITQSVDSHPVTGFLTLNIKFNRASNEQGNNVTSIVTGYKLYLGTSSVPRTIFLSNMSNAELGGSPGQQTSNGFTVTFARQNFTHLTVVARSDYGQAWSGYHVSLDITGSDVGGSATETVSQTPSNSPSQTLTPTATPSPSVSVGADLSSCQEGVPTMRLKSLKMFSADELGTFCRNY
eukprot:c21302_g1_i2.p1 GENE.c21302_g1_i2~~c21302_g1_i2.p1  ORF type:complete len:702 (+),score=301.34 c21302_g1_i2:88-2193(+)